MSSKSEVRILSKHLKAILIVLILLVTVLSLYFIFVKARIFDISDITVTGAGKFVNETDLIEISRSALEGKNILLLKTTDVTASLLSVFHGAKTITIIKQLPNKIQITVTERVPIAVFRNTASKELFLVDSDGYVLGIVSDAQNLPVIDYASDIKVGYFIPSNLVPLYSEIIKSLQNDHLDSSSMSFFDKYSQVYLSDGTQVILSNQKDVQQSLVIADEILKNLSGEKKVVKKIDLRYDKVIVSYE